MRAVALSTKDNPKDPFDDFKAWLNYDVKFLHHNVVERLARVAKVSPSLTEEEYVEEIERAVDSIIEHDPTNLFIKIVREIE